MNLSVPVFCTAGKVRKGLAVAVKDFINKKYDVDVDIELNWR